MSATNLHQRRANLLALRDRIDAQLELLTDMIREQEDGAADPAPAPKPAAETPAPKAPRPVTGAKSGIVDLAPSGSAERVADALLGGPLSARQVEMAVAGVSYTTVQKALKSRPDWFAVTGEGRATRWELTQEGRQAAQSRRES